MKNIKNYINENIKTDVNILIGRFQPITLGHLKCAEYIWNIYHIPTVLCIIDTIKEDNKHPFLTSLLWSSYNRLKQRKYIIDIIKVKSADIVKIIEELNFKNYNISYWTCGTDRYKTYKRMVDKYAPQIELVEIKRGDEDISATKVRQAIKIDDENEFKRLVPNEIYNLYNKLRNLININESILRSTGLSKDDIKIECFKKWIEENASKSRIKSINIKNNKVFIKGDIIINPNVTSINPSIEIEELEGDFDCIGCKKLESLEGAPSIVKEDFDCIGCKKLESLEGAPKEVGGNFNCSYCDRLETLEGAPKKVGGTFNCIDCNKLVSLENAPKEVEYTFNCSYCDRLETLEGAPKEVGCSFFCYSCKNLKSLEGAPKEVGDYFNCSNCAELITLKGAPKEVGGDFDCSCCRKLQSLEGAPKEVGGSFFCTNCGRSFTVGDVMTNSYVTNNIQV